MAKATNNKATNNNKEEATMAKATNNNKAQDQAQDQAQQDQGQDQAQQDQGQSSALQALHKACPDLQSLPKGATRAAVFAALVGNGQQWQQRALAAAMQVVYGGSAQEAAFQVGIFCRCLLAMGYMTKNNGLFVLTTPAPGPQAQAQGPAAQGQQTNFLPAQAAAAASPAAV